jgi:multidrug efflux pump subunit AcrA (membrane-fusion protein)
MQIRVFKITTLVLIVFIFSSCVPINTPEPTIVVPEQQINIEPDVRVSGNVELRQSYLLSFPISGIVKEMFVEEGQYVKIGDMIARLDTTAIEAEIAREESALTVAQRNLERVSLGADQAEIKEAQYQIERAKASRAISLVQATQNAIEVAGAEAKLEYLLSLPLPEDVAVARAQVEQAQGLLDIVKDQLQLTELSSPMDCQVIKLFVQENEYTPLGKPVVEISDTKDLILVVEIDDRDFSSIKIGDKANVYINALPDINATAEVVNIRYDENVGGFIAEMEFIEQPDGLLWGMTVEVSFIE